MRPSACATLRAGRCADDESRTRRPSLLIQINFRNYGDPRLESSISIDA
ncbi:hypothetical protein C7S16_4786 [Burkholderia thailandensis]|uniref:Uncharacterized protein n=1 Tax=Burkholderia thailandensis TaxID=57975 RepID=A0AAW9CIS2_BURTH|nr:hypothetical protein [Burkholderia thailandensis]MDW9250855.1 hypothetical protein [Burkholderia thailandensis]